MCSAGFLSASWNQKKEIFAVKCLFDLEGCTKLEKSWCNGPDYPAPTVHLVLNSSLWMERCTCWMTLSLLNLQCIYLQPWSDGGLTPTLFCRRAGGGLMRSDVQLALIKPTEIPWKILSAEKSLVDWLLFVCFHHSAPPQTCRRRMELKWNSISCFTSEKPPPLSIMRKRWS